MKNQLRQIQEFFDAHTSFCVLSHIRPDGDAYGTALGFALVLRAMGKEAIVYSEDGLIPNYHFLPGKDLVQKTPSTPPPASTGIIAVDTSTLPRLGKTFENWNRQPDLNLDHHATNPGYAKINVIDGESPAAAQLLADLIEALDLPCPPEAAANLYVGLMTDTGSFRYRGTSAHTLEVAADLVTMGADPAWAAQHCYQSSSLSRFQLLREVLNQSRFALGNRVAYYRLTPELFQKTGARSEEVENFLEFLQTVETVEVAFMLEQMPEGLIRASLRSRGHVDVSQIAAKFGGGGHPLAAGIRSPLPIADLETSLLQEIESGLIVGT